MKKCAVDINRRLNVVELVHQFRPISGRFLLLLIALYVNRSIGHIAPEIWVLVPIFLAVTLARARYCEDEKLIVRLWQLVGLLSAIYSLIHYPLLPPANDSIFTVGLYVLLLLAWGISTASGILCFRIPSLSILPPAFLLWGNSMAGLITGLPTTIHIDVQPLTEVSVCIGLGLLVNQIYLRKGRNILGSPEIASNRLVNLDTNNAFARLLLLIAIAVHLANYYWAFYTKMTLDGPLGAWLTENNPAYIFLAALDDGHIIFSGYPHLVRRVYGLLDATHFYSSLWVLSFQAAAIAAFLMPKRAFVILLLMFDVMHASIILIAGANFWPWIILNVIIVVVVTSPDFRRQPILLRIIATGFILIAPYFVRVTMLGWYDSGANNKLYFAAVDETGKRYAVPTNFFTFYSYSFGHMDYATPDPKSAIAVGSPNGGTQDYQIFKAGRTCNVAALYRPNWNHLFDREKLSAFIRNYHRLAMVLYSKLGMFPYDVYPHHFYVPASESEGFRKLDKRRIIAYIYRRESVCLSYTAGVLHRKVISSAEYKIDVSRTSHDGQ